MCSHRGKASGSRHVDPVDSEQVEEQLRAKRLAAKARREERVGRWARALVERLELVRKGRTKSWDLFGGCQVFT